MAAPQVPKYQAIYASLRTRILDGDLAPGERLPAQQELADSFGVTLMTLRQAIASLAADGLVSAEPGKGTFVTDRPVDIRVGNLSSFAQQMSSAGIAMETEVLSVSVIAAGTNDEIAQALDCSGEICEITRRRSVGGVPLSLQRSYLSNDDAPTEPFVELVDNSLYDMLERATGSTLAEARESITAVVVSGDDAANLAVDPAHPALLSVRTSINQFGRSFLYDQALLVAGRCVLNADRTANNLSLSFGYEPS